MEEAEIRGELLRMVKEKGPSEMSRLLAEVVREQAENYTGLLKERWIRAAQRLEDAYLNCS